MRKTRFGAVVASAALASVTVLGAGTAMAQDNDEPNTVSITSEGNYTMTATQTGQCEVTFDLESLRDGGYGNWRGDFRVGDEDPITQSDEVDPTYGNRGLTYRPVVTNDEGTADAIAGRANPYDVELGSAEVVLTEEHIVPDFESAGVSETYTLPGVEANATGEHVISFGVYQGPVRQDSGAYEELGEITITGCPTLEPEPAPTLPERISSELNLPDFSGLSSNLSS